MVLQACSPPPSCVALGCALKRELLLHAGSCEKTDSE